MVGIYSRQSVDKQDSISIESQISKGERLLSDGEPRKLYTDRGFSGKNTERPAFKELIADIENGVTDKVIVYKIDRISRNLLDFANIMDTFVKNGVEFVSVNEQFDTSTPIGKAMLYIVMIFAQLERETIQMRIKDNYYSRGEQGFYLGGHAPYGFRKIGSTLYNKKTCTFETETETSANVKKIYDLYANTDMSLGKLFRYMKDENSGDDITNVVFIRRILRNPVYVRANADVYLYLQQKGATMNNDIEEYIGVNGIYIYGDRKNQTKSKFSDLSKDFATIGLHEGFIDAEIWLRCQRKLDQNKQLKKSGAGTHSWLSGIWKCKYCGFAINVVNNCRGHFYINCGGKIRKMCKGREKTYEVYQIEEVVQQSLFDYLNEKQSVETAADIIVSDTYESNQLKIDIAKIDKAIDKLLEQAAFSDDVVGDYFTKKIKELDRKKHRLTEQLEDIYKQQNSKRKIRDINISEISDNWDNWNIEQKKAIAKRIIRLVEVSDEGMEIHYI